MEAEIDRLHAAIDGLSGAIRDLKAELGVVRENARTDFSRLIDRQDPKFRWLAGIIIMASAITIATFAIKH